MFEVILRNMLKIADTVRNKKIIIWGTGECAQITTLICNMLKLNIEYYVDNDKSKWDTKLNNTYIKSPKYILDDTDYVILICSMYFNEISSQVQRDLKKCDYYSVFNIEKVYNKSYFKVGKYTYGYKKWNFKGTYIKEIGAFCSIAWNVLLVDNHPMGCITTSNILKISKEEYSGEEKVPGIVSKEKLPKIDELGSIGVPNIIIGNDVWIAENVIIFNNVKIGNGAIIGAGSIVKKDVPDYAIVVSAPARIIRYRFSREEIDILNKVQWWNWSDEKISENINLLANKEMFFEKFKKFL
ncbi:CatB-related O-acetyltransferase [Clostridium sp. JS66]|uniref:CatB-related O-acetyltransferase n=1 Tax=Clostridium sp. JS66 TaxID=3064705 RepID=UPI00298DE471|nr:CatB-related O-acetyltransferase [Clostridium sp. JS66]WPC41030.1 CatB-related O-acetyltransferase [Clostridium sp. JS66]